MRVFILTFFLLLIEVVVSEKYTTKYDNIDIDEILRSDRLLNNYFQCVMDKGPCTPDGLELKKHIPDGLKTDCEKCSDKQKDGSKKVIKFLAKNKPDKFKELVEKYDPDKTYLQRHKDELEKEGIYI